MNGVLVLAVFMVCAVLMYRRVMPAIVAVPVMAVAMSLVAGVPFAHLPAIVTDGSKALADVYVAVIFGALLGRVTLDTGIARALVNLAAEYGGENPFILAMVLCAIVALLFTSLSGLGAVIMVGSIVLPIMLTTGVPRKAAATLFLMAFALGFIFNLVNWKFYTRFFGVDQAQMVRYAVVLAIIDALALVVYALVAFRRERGYATWAARAEDDEPSRGVSAWALFTPVLPLALYYLVHLDATPAFVVSALYGVLVTRPRQAISTLVACAIRGVEDVAPAILLFIGIGMLLTATKEPQFAQALQPFVGGWLRNPAAFVALFGLASPLVLYRGPLNPFGVGIAIFSVLLASHVLPPVVLVAAVMAVVQVQNVCDPTNTANVWVATFTGVTLPEITKRTLPFQVGVATLAALATVVAAPSLFDVHAFASLVPMALADTAFPGLFAPAASANRIAVASDGSSLDDAAANGVVRALDDGTWHAFRVAHDANDGDCARKSYAVYVAVATTTFTLSSGTDLDVGVRLEDCGGWIVDEWHDHAVLPGTPSADDANRLANDGVARLRDWAARNPVSAAHLFTEGLAVKPGDAPTYFFTLFKTVDGNMRLYVRGGGPAYAAGLRSGDVVDRLDGRFWWEYGTYQTQLRAYDGRPHRFEIERNGKTIDVNLGEPYIPLAQGGGP